MSLFSHPRKLLSTHVAEVRQAANRIVSQHSLVIRNSTDLLDWIDWAVSMHDVGKGTAAFQKYICDVRGFRGDSRRKAHTPFSFVASMGYARVNRWSWQKTLAVSVAALNHHSGFKTHDELQAYLRNGDWQDLLVDQLEGFNWDTVSEAVFPGSVSPHLEPCYANDRDLSRIAKWFENEIVIGALHGLFLSDAINYRLRCQFAFSVLLEADKAYLILSDSDREKYRAAALHAISPAIVERFIRSQRSSKLNDVRNRTRSQLVCSLASRCSDRIQTMTLPTGSGKTLLAATWALKHRQCQQADGHTPPIVIVLPFLSIIEQTQTVYRDLLADDGSLISFHSLSARDQHETEDADAAEFFLDTWHGDVIITTFDQFLFALLDPRSRFQMRFHQLADALIVLDEVQALPCVLWDIVSHVVNQLAEIGNCRVLAMSATQTGFLTDATEIIENPSETFKSLDRYEIMLRHRDAITLDDFANEVVASAKRWNHDGERVLLVLNTRNSARTVRDELVAAGYQVLFISADVTPLDRLATIEKIKKGTPCIVVSTQCVEAGVDIDMSLVIRDFAPLDSLIQVAGRCNRNAERGRERIEVVRLTNENGKQYGCMIYDRVLLQETTDLLKSFVESNGDGIILEKEVYDLSCDYFERLRTKKDLGEKHTKSFARWESMPSIRELLRGNSDNQESFVVVEKSPELPEELRRVSKIDDRWERRRELRKLTSRIAAVSVSVYCKRDFAPQQFAERDATQNFWLLRDGYYDSERGIDFENGYTDEDRDSWGKII